MKTPTTEQIKSARTSAGLSQKAAGELVYSAVGTWFQWENGKRKMHPAFWELFCRKVSEIAK